MNSAKLIKEEEFTGYDASKREYFHEFKAAVVLLTLLITGEGIPVEFLMTAGSIHDNIMFQVMEINLP